MNCLTFYILGHHLGKLVKLHFPSQQLSHALSSEAVESSVMPRLRKRTHLGITVLKCPSCYFVLTLSNFCFIFAFDCPSKSLNGSYYVSCIGQTYFRKYETLFATSSRCSYDNMCQLSALRLPFRFNQLTT